MSSFLQDWANGAGKVLPSFLAYYWFSSRFFRVPRVIYLQSWGGWPRQLPRAKARTPPSWKILSIRSLRRSLDLLVAVELQFKGNAKCVCVASPVTAQVAGLKRCTNPASVVASVVASAEEDWLLTIWNWVERLRSHLTSIARHPVRRSWTFKFWNSLFHLGHVSVPGAHWQHQEITSATQNLSFHRIVECEHGT